MPIPFPPARERSREKPERGGRAVAESATKRGDHGELNRMLAGLPEEELALLRPHLVPVELPLRHLFFERNETIPAVWFIESGAASWLVEMADGNAIEAGTIGNEGMEGIPVFLGTGSAPSRSVMQVPGYGKRMDAGVFRELLPKCPTLHARLHRYTQLLIVLIAQTAACNRLHELENRCARWLLMAHDRANRAESFYLTQDYLSIMLGVRRAGVSQAASALKRRGLIDYTRGRVTVLDREGLEKASCECYQVVQDHAHKLLG